MKYSSASQKEDFYPMCRDLIAGAYNNIANLKVLMETFGISSDDLKNYANRYPYYQTTSEWIEENEDLLGRVLHPVPETEVEFAIDSIAEDIDELWDDLNRRYKK
jgi:hypothetical protein